MFGIKTFLAFILALSAFGASVAADTDPFLTAFQESRTLGRGLTFYVNGQAIPGVVVSVSDKYVVARSTAQGVFAIRLDRLDAVAGFVGMSTEPRPAK